MPLRADSKVLEWEGSLPEEEEFLGSAEATGELIWAPENLRNPPGLASAARRRERSTSPPAGGASRLLGTAAARFEDPPDRPKAVELDGYNEFIHIPVRNWKDLSKKGRSEDRE